MPCENFLAALEQLNERLTTRPCVLAAAHSPVGKVGVAVNTGVSQYFLFDGNGSVEEFGMALGKADPLGFALVKAKIAPGASPPLVVFGETNASIFEDAEDIVVRHTVFDKRKTSFDVGLGRKCSLLRFGFRRREMATYEMTGSSPTHSSIGLIFMFSGTPPHLRRR